jgi:hypothetical protein
MTPLPLSKVLYSGTMGRYSRYGKGRGEISVLALFKIYMEVCLQRDQGRDILPIEKIVRSPGHSENSGGY